MSKKVSLWSIIVISILIILIYLFLCLSYVFYPIKYKTNILNYSNLYGVEKELIASVINAESSFKRDIVSKKGAVGLMQIMPKTAEWLALELKIDFKKEKLFEPDYNIRLGTYYLSYLTNKFNDLTVVLCAYNAGEGVINNWLKNSEYSKDGKKLIKIPYKATKDYVEKVFKGIKIYQKKLK